MAADMSDGCCGDDGGRGIGAGHICRCTATLGHEPIYGAYHGCECGALWKVSV